MTLLYGVLLYDGPPRQSTPPPLTPMVQQVVTAALSMLLSVARFNLYTLQVYDIHYRYNRCTVGPSGGFSKTQEMKA